MRICKVQKDTIQSDLRGRRVKLECFEAKKLLGQHDKRQVLPTGLALDVKGFWEHAAGLNTSEEACVLSAVWAGRPMTT